MKKVILLNKKEGETPLEALENFRAKHREYKDVKMTYAGRLDPLVSGLLLVLAGDSVHEKEKYLKLSKEYEFTVLFGFATDTYDILGKVVKNRAVDINPKAIRDSLKFFRGKFRQKYPMYSSKPVDGKPLFAHARSGLKVKAPSHQVEVKKLSLLSFSTITKKALRNNIHRRIEKVSGDFRQKEILNLWDKYLNEKKSTKYQIAKFKIKCSSGTYVRGIADSLGRKMGTSSLALSIKRTKIGNYH